MHVDVFAMQPYEIVGRKLRERAILSVAKLIPVPSTKNTITFLQVSIYLFKKLIFSKIFFAN